MSSNGGAAPPGPVVLEGLAVSEGIALGWARHVRWEVPRPPHEVVGPDGRDRELERFRQALEWAKRRLEETKADTEARLGAVEARIFDPQLLMLEDPQVVEGTRRYIAENRLTAARAFDWRMLELKERWARTSHPMVLDRLNDLEDLKLRVLGRLMNLPSPWELGGGEDVVVVAPDLTPSFVARLDPAQVAAVVTEEGTRAAHWAILARALRIPAVAGLAGVCDRVPDGVEVVVDGRGGRVVASPGAAEKRGFERRRSALAGLGREMAALVGQESATLDKHRVVLRANLDLPGEAAVAREHGAEGVGLFRTEFLAVGRSTVPAEDEQYRAYRTAVEAFPDHAVVIRTFDLGGDKFPLFLRMPAEKNPFLGRRGVRICLDEPELFAIQLRALLRAGAHGDLRVMLPVVNTSGEVEAVRELLETAAGQLREAGATIAPSVKLGIAVETPASALNAARLAPHVDFFSLGTNDLIQYTLAVDRNSARLSGLFDPFHPAVVHQVSAVVHAARSAGIEVAACGEMAASPLGAVLLLGLGVPVLSVAWPSLPEIKKLIRGIRLSDARQAALLVRSSPSRAAAEATLTEVLMAAPEYRPFHPTTSSLI